MIDKSGHGKNNSKDNEGKASFTYDLDLDKGRDSHDDLGFDDELLMEDDDFDSDLDAEQLDNTEYTNELNPAASKASGGFLKNYGIVLLVAGGIVVYSLYSFMGAGSPEQVPPSSLQATSPDVTTQQISTETSPDGMGGQPSDNLQLSQEKPLEIAPEYKVDESLMPKDLPDLSATIQPQEMGAEPPAAKPDNSMSMPETSSNIATSTPAPTSSVSKDELNNLSSSMDQKLNSISQTVNSLVNKIDAQPGIDKQEINNLKQLAQTTQSQVFQIANKMKGIIETISVLTDKVKKQEAVLATIVDTQIGRPASKKKGEKGFVIDAIISGRAWVSTVDGRQYSVTQGDRIPGYGKVVNIDSSKGTVTTDTGIVLTQ